jgi:hypothetical protein
MPPITLSSYLLLRRVLVLEQVSTHTQLALLSIIEWLEYSLAQIIIPHRKKAYHPRPSTHHLPAQLPRSIFPISTEAQPRTERYNRNRISNKDRIITIRLKSACIFLCLGFSFFLGFDGLFFRSGVGFFGFCFGGDGFVLEAVGLGGGLDGLRGEV